MGRVPSSDTIPEQIFRKALWARGYRYSICSSKLAGNPDVVLPSRQTVIFVDGDYWHGNQWRSRKHLSLEAQFIDSPSQAYWIQKITRNMERDCAVTRELTEQGWTVLRFWESEIRENVEECVKVAVEAIEKPRYSSAAYLLAQRSFAEFFSGIGLMRIGLENQGWRIRFANDIDPDKYEMYHLNFQDADKHFMLKDVHRLHASDVPDVTLATASFPCNDLSLAGSRSGLNGKQSSAFWGFMKVLERKRSRRPPLVLLENVTGFLSSHEGKDFESACLALNELGYAVDAFVLDAADFVPQSRQRLFIVGSLQEDSPAILVKESVHFYESAVRPKALADFIFGHPNVHWSIRELPKPPKLSQRLTDVLEDIPFGADEWWSDDRAKYLFDQMSDKHRKIAIMMTKGKNWSYGTVFRRIRNEKSMAELRTDGVAGCLRTPRGGSGRQILVKAGRGEFHARLLTPRECARLMGADDYKIEVPLNRALFGFGDAVCVPVVEWIAKHYLNPLINELLRGRAITSEL